MQHVSTIAHPAWPKSTDSLERVHPRVAAKQLQQLVVETEEEVDTHDTQAEVGEHGDGTELEQAGQRDHQPREHHTGPPHAPPVHQIHNCKTRWTLARNEKFDELY